MSKEFNYSFIIPHKNCPDLLQRCVDSIPERDDVQVIVVDDNSDEGKKPALKERKNLQVILLDAEHSKGAGRARNVGLKNAEGKWLLFPDSDDYYNDEFLSILDKYINSSYDVIYFNFDYKDGKTGEKLTPLYFRNYFCEYDGKQESKDKIKFHHNVPWTKMVSHEYVNKYGISFEETINGNDIFFSMMVGFYTNNIYVENSPVYSYLRNQNSILTTKETVDSAMCRLEHLVKINYFYDYIGYAEWKNSVIKRILKKVYYSGFPFLCALVMNAKNIYKSRKEWVMIFDKR